MKPTASKFEKLEDGKPYRAKFKALAGPLPGKFREQLRVTFDIEVDGGAVEISDWLNCTLNSASNGKPSSLLAFLNACAGKQPATKVTDFNEAEAPYTWSYREDEQPEFALVGSEVIVRGQHAAKQDGSGDTWFGVASYAPVPPAPAGKPKTAKAEAAPPASEETPAPADAEAPDEDEIPFET